MPKISVVIGTLNQKEKLKKVLDSFIAQSLPPNDYELIVVDSTSKDGTHDLLKTYLPSYLFRYHIQENQGKAAARNRGVEMARSDLIFITDADMIAHPDLLKTHLLAHQTCANDASFEGLTYNMENYNWPPEPEALSPYIRKKYKENAVLGWHYFLTGNISFKKKVFEEMGKFDESFKGYGWEDLELGYRFKKAGIPHYYLPSAINYHYHVLNPQEEISRNLDKGKSARQFLKKHPELKLFLGLNPLSVWIHKHIPQTGYLYKQIENWLQKNKTLRQRVAIWFLSEHAYLTGILTTESKKS